MKLVGQPTRGKTAPNRLRKTDAFLAIAYAERLRAMRGLYVDLGYGAAPVTSRETLWRLRRINPSLRVLGVEIDPARVAEAQRFTEPGLEFRLGGFNLPLRAGERAGIVRAFNVLRQYDEAAVAEALAHLAVHLEPAGLVVEGTSDPTGRLMTFLVHERSAAGLARAALVFAPSLGAAFEPRQLQAVLPKTFIHHAEPGGDVDAFFAAWQRAWRAALAPAGDARGRFACAARALADEGWAAARRPTLLRRGFLALGPAWPARGAAGPA